MSAQRVRGITLDTGALLALERGQPTMRARLQRALENRMEIAVPAGVVAQSWRGGGRQARIARLLSDPRTDIPALDAATGRAVGELCGRSGHPDVVDVHVALYARSRDHIVVTSDPDDIRRIYPTLTVVRV